MTDADVAAAVGAALEAVHQQELEVAANVSAASAAQKAGECTICLGDEGPPFPAQGGCGCRGDSGLAHTACRIEAATHLHTSQGAAVWWICGTCNQRYTGLAQISLACAAVRVICTSQASNTDVKMWACNNLAMALNDQGKCAEAVVIFKEVLAAEKRALGPEHPDTLNTSNNLATALVTQGKFAKAVVIYKEVLAAEKRVLGPEHPDTLNISNNLALALDAQGKNAEAVIIYTGVLVAQKRVLGPEHPETLGTANNLAAALDAQGKHVEAEAIYKEVLAATKRVLGPEHPHTLSTTNNLVRNVPCL